MLKAGTNRFFLLSIIFLHLCFFVWQVLHGNYFLTDSHEYLNAAANLKSDFLLYCGNLTKPLNFELFSKRPPIYPLILAACQLISPNFILVIILQNLLSVTGIYMIRQMMLKYGYTAKYDILFIVLLLFSPSQFIYTNLIMSETLLQFLIILLIWFFIKIMNGKNLFFVFVYSIVLSLSVLTKPVFIYFIFANALFFIWLSIKRVTVKPFLLSLIPLLFLFSYQYRNFRQTGVFEVSSIVTINLLDYNAYFFLINYKGLQTADSSIAHIDSLSSLKGSYKAEVTFKKQQATEIIMKSPVRYALFHTKGISGFFLDPGRFDLVNFLNLNHEKANGLLYQINQSGPKGTLKFLFEHSFVLLLLLVIIFIFNLLKLYFFTRFIFQNSSKWYIKGFVLFLILYVAILTGPLGASRFMMPFIPIYIGCGLLFLSKRKKQLINSSELKK